MAIQMTREQYKAKYGVDPDFSTAKLQPARSSTSTNPMGGAWSDIKEAAGGGVDKMKKGYEQAKVATNPLTKTEAGLSQATGALGVALSPLAPIFKPVGKALGLVQDKLSETPLIKGAAGNFVKNPDGTTDYVENPMTGNIKRGLENVSNTSELVGAFGGVQGAFAKNPSYLKAQGTITRHLQSANLIIAEQGQVPGIMARLKENIVSGLKGIKGNEMPSASNAVAKLNVADYPTVNAFADAAHTAVQKTLQSPVGKAADVATGLLRGAGAAASKTANALAQTGKSVLKGKDVKALSIFTGEKDAVIEAALKNPDAADIGIRGGDAALREAVQRGSQSSIKARTEFIQGYNKAFEQLVSLNPGKLVSRQKVLYQFVDDLEKAGVTIKNGEASFDTSLIKANPGEAAKIKDAYTAVMKWDDWSLVGVNRLKQMVGRLTKFPTETGGSSKSPFLGQFYHFLDETIKKELPPNSAKVYAGMNKKFSENIDLYDDVVDAFNSGDPFRRLAQLFGENSDSLRQIVEFYEKTTGEKIAPVIAGRALSEKKVAGTWSILNPRSYLDFFIDPKIQGEIVTKLGRLKGN